MKASLARCYALGLAGALALSSCRSNPANEVDSPGRSGTYSLDVYTDGHSLHLLLADYAPDEKRPGLFHRRSEDGGETWSEPVRVDSGATPAYVPYRGIDPQIAASGDRVVAVWTTEGDDLFGYGTGPMATALSADGGKTWLPGPNPADDGLTTAHEFIDIAAGEDAVFHLVWLDDRDEEKGLRRGLRYAQSRDAGASWSPNQTLDPHICGCCWTHLRTSADGTLFVLFRDEDPDPSDMKLAISSDGGSVWEDQGVVADFQWLQRGCPHTTGGLSVMRRGDQESLHALVQTGREDVAGIYYLASRTRGRDWSEPRRLADGGAHYADLAASGESLAAVWQEQEGTRTVILASLSQDRGESWQERCALSGDSVSAGYPRVVPAGGHFRVLWTESRDGRAHVFRSVRFPGCR